MQPKFTVINCQIPLNPAFVLIDRFLLRNMLPLITFLRPELQLTLCIIYWIHFSKGFPKVLLSSSVKVSILVCLSKNPVYVVHTTDVCPKSN